MGHYAKGHGNDDFWPWMERRYPKEFVLRTLRANGSRQDFCVEGAAPVLMMLVYFLEWLDERMRGVGYSNILEECLFVQMTCIEMVAQLRVAAIVDLAISKPVRWLIVVMTSVVAVGAAFLAMLAWDTLQRAQNAS